MHYLSSETWFGDWFLGSPDSSVQTFVLFHLGKGIISISEMEVPTEQIGSSRDYGRRSIHFNMGCDPS